MVYRTLVTLAGKRVPLIRFRKGGYNYETSAGGQANQASSNPQYAAGAGNSRQAAGSQGAIEDWELPRRYWRKPIDPVEMEYINRGGPA